MADEKEPTNPGTDPQNRPPSTTRRTFVRGVVAATGGIAAAAYVKPSMQSLGVTGAMAQAAPGGTPSGTPGDTPGTPSGTPGETPGPGGHGCSVGYWGLPNGQGMPFWQSDNPANNITGADPGDATKARFYHAKLLTSVFVIPGGPGPGTICKTGPGGATVGGDTMLAATNYPVQEAGEDHDACNKVENLLKQAVPALVNSYAHPGCVNPLYSTPELIIAAVNAALATINAGGTSPLAGLLETSNNLCHNGCGNA